MSKIRLVAKMVEITAVTKKVHKVDSSVVGYVCWHGGEKGYLDIELNNGEVYRYPKVSKEIFDNFLTAESQGIFYNREIKPNYAYLHMKNLKGTLKEAYEKQAA